MERRQRAIDALAEHGWVVSSGPLGLGGTETRHPGYPGVVISVTTEAILVSHGRYHVLEEFSLGGWDSAMAFSRGYHLGRPHKPS